MKRECPRVVVAGTNSGVGKTSVALALVSALQKRGLAVQTFKVGPDYLDPTYLELASGRPCYNLDGWMAGQDYVRSLFADRASSADVAVIEGVMGLFDGSDPVGSEGSTAEIASWLEAPVLLVVDVHGMARSLAAVVKGYTEFDSRVKIAGVVANRCGSERHGYWLGETLKAFGLPLPVAAPPRGAFPNLPSRHLGLVTADRSNLTQAILEELGAALERHGSVDEILRIARDAPPVDAYQPGPPRPMPTKRMRLGLAYDQAFHFYYNDNLDALESRGCELVRFSPIEDARLPEELNAVYFGGGYPEEYAQGLSENTSMLESVRRFASSGKTIYAECGGLMYLAQGIQSVDGASYELAGVMPGRTRMLTRLKSLGYVEVTLTRDSLFGTRGDVLRGHEFHYSELTGDPSQEEGWDAVYSLRRMRSDVPAAEGFQKGRTVASYVHMHFASRPGAVEHFVSVCAGSGVLRK